MTAIWCGDPTWIAQNFGFLKMSNFDICVVHLGFGAILGDPKFEPFHVGSPHHVAVTGYTWLIVVINSNNELCSRSNNTVSKAFWQKKVLQEQKISCCEGIYIVLLFMGRLQLHSTWQVWQRLMLIYLAWFFWYLSVSWELYKNLSHAVFITTRKCCFKNLDFSIELKNVDIQMV